MKAAVVLALGLAAAAAPLAAQEMPESYREVQLRALEAQRRLWLSMADSMPENLYRDKATPAQRDFAAQVLHHANALGFLGRILRAGAAPAMDTAAAYNSRAGMRAAINARYDWAANVLRNQTAQQRSSTVNLFGTPMPGWQVWDEMHQHAWWTAGQIVANFRKNNMAPPSFFFY